MSTQASAPLLCARSSASMPPSEIPQSEQGTPGRRRGCQRARRSSAMDETEDGAARWRSLPTPGASRHTSRDSEGRLMLKDARKDGLQ
jgi:hypothetical protein